MNLATTLIVIVLGVMFGWTITDVLTDATTLTDFLRSLVY